MTASPYPEGAARSEERLAHLAMWIKALPADVDNKPDGMVKLVRHLLADMDALRQGLAKSSREGRGA